jgi:hypothetical protein
MWGANVSQKAYCATRVNAVEEVGVIVEQPDA